MDEMELNSLAKRFHKGKIDGKILAKMVENGELSGSDRRRVTKMKKQIEIKKNKEEARINKKKAKAAAYAEKRGLNSTKTLGLNREENL